MIDLSVNFAGLKLKNPLIAAAGPLTTCVENVKRLADAGIAAIVSKTGFVRKEYEQWVGRKNIFPYKPVYKYQSLQNGRLLSLPTLADMPVSDMAKRVEEMKRYGVTVIGSIMGLTPQGYVESARILADAGADAIELDLCCTMPEFTTRYKYAGQNVNFSPKKYAHLVDIVKSAVTVPVGVKSTVSLYLYGNILEGLIRAKLKNKLPDYLTLVGQLDENPGVNLNTLQPLIPHFPTLGWQGTLSGLTYSALATFSSTLGTGNPYLSASGGIRDHEGVITAVAMGATTVQLMTVVLDKGPGIITRILNDMTAYLHTHGIVSVTDIIGTASRDLIPSFVLGKFMLERDTLQGLIHASVREDICTGCGLCESVCTEGAVHVNDGIALIDTKRCRACNLCILKCPAGCITLENSEHLERLIAKYKSIRSIGDLRDFMSKKKVGILDKVLFIKNMKQLGLT